MIQYFIKLSIRKFQAQWLLFSGSILTVSIGAICISLLYSFVYNEITMNEFHTKANEIYMMNIKISAGSEKDPFSASQNLNFNYKHYPELNALTTVIKSPFNNRNVHYRQAVFSPEILIADSNFFKIFDFPLLRGNKQEMLKNPNEMVITRDFSDKVFGNQDPVGQELKIDLDGEKIFTIAGVLDKIPSNSSLYFDILLPVHSGTYHMPAADFLLRGNHFEKTAFENKIQNLGADFFKGCKLSITPLQDIYFLDQPNFIYQIIFSKFGNRTDVFVLSVILLIILLISVFNFSGFQVILIQKEIRYLGLEKALGIRKPELILQKFTEIGLQILLSLLLAVFAYVALLPHFNQFTKGTLNPSPVYILGLNLIVILIMIGLAMIYPVLVISRIPIPRSLKKEIIQGKFNRSQKTIVTFQYGLTIGCIIASLVIIRQVSFMLHKNLGFNTEEVVRVSLYKDKPFDPSLNETQRRFQEAEKQKDYQFIQHQLSEIPEIIAYTQGEPPVDPVILSSWKVKGSDQDYLSEKGFFVQEGYLKVLGLTLTEGRFFDPVRGPSESNKLIINEAARKYWNIRDIHSCRMQRNEDDTLGFEVIGVVKDFNYQHLAFKPQPIFMQYFGDSRMDYLIKFRKGTMQSGIKAISDLFYKVNPGFDFEYSLLSDQVVAMSQKEKRLSLIYVIFTMIAIFLTTVSVFILASYEAQRRIREIGIRRVNGASVSNIILLLHKDFYILIAIAFLLAAPVGWYAMHQWLQHFAYQSSLSWWIFAIAGLTVFLISALTISLQSRRAALLNPAESLRMD